LGKNTWGLSWRGESTFNQVGLLVCLWEKRENHLGNQKQDLLLFYAPRNTNYKKSIGGNIAAPDKEGKPSDRTKENGRTSISGNFLNRVRSKEAKASFLQIRIGGRGKMGRTMPKGENHCQTPVGKTVQRHLTCGLRKKPQL